MQKYHFWPLPVKIDSPVIKKWKGVDKETDLFTL